MFDENTIVALATPVGVGSVGIIRISGKMSFEIAASIYKGTAKFEEYLSHSIHHGYIYDNRAGELIDEVLISKMKAPASFTREDIVEINCHGGPIVIQKIIELICRLGARVADPGEFTKRAFLNGRIDLSQAEAVMDLIQAKSTEAHKAAIEQLEGKIFDKIRGLRKRLVELLAHIEVTVDYPEHDIEEITSLQVIDGISGIKKILNQIRDSFQTGRILREGLKVVIAGRPNVGKSSLLNILTGTSRAIVTEIPGTTRDVIEEYLDIMGIPVKLSDTAGIRETDDHVEKLGVELAEKEIENADLIIDVVDASNGFTNEDKQILDSIAGKKVLVVVNKIDVCSSDKLNDLKSILVDHPNIFISVKNENGIEDIKSFIKDQYNIGRISLNQEVMLTNVRHKNLIEDSIKSIDEAINAFDNGMTLDIISIDVMAATDSLGRITGESVSDEIVHEIFSRFCLGK